jgi:hypothetical protein
MSRRVLDGCDFEILDHIVTKSINETEGKARRLNKQNILIVGVAAAIFLLIAPLSVYAPTPTTPPKSSPTANSSSNGNNGCPAGYYRPYSGLGCILTTAIIQNNSSKTLPVNPQIGIVDGLIK